MNRRIWIACLALLAAGLGAAQAQTPAPATTPDSLKVTFCGTSGPLPVRDRAKPCLVVQAGGALYLVDIGPEATENIQTWRLPIATTKAVFITHLHSDHIGDLGEFNMQSWVAGRLAPLIVVGPPGVDHLAAGFNEAYGPDHGFRNAHHEHDAVKLPIAAGLLSAKVVPPPRSGTTVVWSENVVKHDPATPAYGYRFDYKGRSVVVSGDTRKWPPLAVAAKGADVLIHEAQNPDMTKTMSQGLAAQGNARMSSIMADTLTYHTSPVEAAEIARMAGVKALVLTHITQAGLPFYNPAAFTKGMDAGGPLDWRIAKDGVTIELPVGSSEIRFGQL
jgi:ribonuclease Z